MVFTRFSCSKFCTTWGRLQIRFAKYPCQCKTTMRGRNFFTEAITIAFKQAKGKLRREEKLSSMSLCLIREVKIWLLSFSGGPLTATMLWTSTYTSPWSRIHFELSPVKIIRVVEAVTMLFIDFIHSIVYGFDCGHKGNYWSCLYIVICVLSITLMHLFPKWCTCFPEALVRRANLHPKVSPPLQWP